MLVSISFTLFSYSQELDSDKATKEVVNKINVLFEKATSKKIRNGELLVKFTNRVRYSEGKLYTTSIWKSSCGYFSKYINVIPMKRIKFMYYISEEANIDPCALILMHDSNNKSIKTITTDNNKDPVIEFNDFSGISFPLKQFSKETFNEFVVLYKELCKIYTKQQGLKLISSVTKKGGYTAYKFTW